MKDFESSDTVLAVPWPFGVTSGRWCAFLDLRRTCAVLWYLTGLCWAKVCAHLHNALFMTDFETYDTVLAIVTHFLLELS